MPKNIRANNTLNNLMDLNILTTRGHLYGVAMGPGGVVGKTGVLVKDLTYNTKFDMGNRDTRIIKTFGYYFAEKNVVHELPSSKKKFLSIFGARAGEVDTFMRANGPSHNQEFHLKLIFEHY